jgi:hypothetical protein
MTVEKAGLPARILPIDSDRDIFVCMRPYTTKEKAKVVAAAVASMVIVGWIFVLAIAFLSAR